MPDLFDAPPIAPGATAEEVQFALRLLYQTASARCSELRHHDYIERAIHPETGKLRRRTTTSGNSAYVLVITDKGRMTLKLGLEINVGDERDPTARHHRGAATSSEAFDSSDFRELRRKILRFVASKS